MVCSKCGANIPDDSKFCVRCGNKIENNITAKNTNESEGKEQNPPKEVHCPGCGAVLDPAAKFCTKCGRKQERGPAQQAAPKPQPAPQSQPAPKPQPAPQATHQKSKSSKLPVIIIVIVLLLIVMVAGMLFYFIGVRSENPLEAVSGLFGTVIENEEKDGNEKEDGDPEDGSGQKEEKGDVALLEPAGELVEQVKSEYEAGNYTDGSIPHSVEAIQQYMTVAEENNLQEEAQEGIDSVYWMYVDSIIRYCDNIISQGAYAAGFEQISDILTNATAITETLTEKGYTVDSTELYAYKEETIQTFRDMYIDSINSITEYENWSRDEAWNYAEQAYSIKENGKPILFDDEDLEDPLRLRYVYSLAWITTKRCETGLADGSLSYEAAVQSMEAILEETDYNLLLIQNIITYGSEAGMDVEKYRNAYNAIVDEIKREQNFTIGNDIGVNSVSSVDLRHFWYFNDLDGEDKYKVDTHNGTTAATREWIRTNVPVILGE